MHFEEGGEKNNNNRRKIPSLPPEINLLERAASLKIGKPRTTAQELIVVNRREGTETPEIQSFLCCLAFVEEIRQH